MKVYAYQLRGSVRELSGQNTLEVLFSGLFVKLIGTGGCERGVATSGAVYGIALTASFTISGAT